MHSIGVFFVFGALILKLFFCAFQNFPPLLNHKFDFHLPLPFNVHTLDCRGRYDLLAIYEVTDDELFSSGKTVTGSEDFDTNCSQGWRVQFPEQKTACGLSFFT